MSEKPLYTPLPDPKEFVHDNQGSVTLFATDETLSPLLLQANIGAEMFVLVPQPTEPHVIEETEVEVEPPVVCTAYQEQPAQPQAATSDDILSTPSRELQFHDGLQKDTPKHPRLSLAPEFMLWRPKRDRKRKAM